MLDLLPLPTRTLTDESIVETRVLTAEEIATLEPIFKEQDAELPDPATSFVVGSIDQEGKVHGFLVMQLKVHAQPMWCEPGREALFGSLVNAAENTIAERVNGCWVYLFAEAGKHSKLASRAGMKLEPWNVYSKFIAPKQQVDSLPAKEEVIQ